MRLILLRDCGGLGNVHDGGEVVLSADTGARPERGAPRTRTHGGTQDALIEVGQESCRLQVH